ncbi:hypothetical protein [Silvimonas soli]|uniref:hypothetical protein n=1 Tax=Silvimonas soli TaxID=2980100 RepID=UPI0024B3BBD5|nr:hypothetical protein [Silvimonas soli]
MVDHMPRQRWLKAHRIQVAIAAFFVFEHKHVGWFCAGVLALSAVMLPWGQ